MPGTTATQGLIYPTQTDRACDGALQIEVLAKGIQARYAVLDGLVDTGEMPEAVLVEWVSDTESADPLGISISWNTVSIDTANGFDTSISAVAITLPYTAPGQLWEIGMFAEGEWPGGMGDPEDNVRVNLRITSQLGVELLKLDSPGVPARPAWPDSGGGSLVTLHKTSGAGEKVTAFWQGAEFETVLHFAQMWAIRVAEA